MRRWIAVLLVTCHLSPVTCLTGCESLHRKFTRKPKYPRSAPAPIIHFQDYTKAMTPQDRYRKHYLMFDYWDDELIRALQASPLNPKRLKRSSSESLTELETLQDLLTDDVAGRLTPLIEQRSKIDRQLQRPGFNETQAYAVIRNLEAQTRQVHRDFFWRDVEEQLKPWPAEPPAAASTQAASP